MTVTAKGLVPAKQLENALTTQYTANGVRAIIDKVTILNTSAGTVSFSAHIVPASGSASDSNQIVKARMLQPGETYSCYELVGQVMNAGDQLVTIASAATSLTMRVSGREVA